MNYVKHEMASENTAVLATSTLSTTYSRFGLGDVGI